MFYFTDLQNTSYAYFCRNRRQRRLRNLSVNRAWRASVADFYAFMKSRKSHKNSPRARANLAEVYVLTHRS